jgi:hypothetical protein
MAFVLVRSTVSPTRKSECKQEKNGTKRGVLDCGGRRCDYRILRVEQVAKGAAIAVGVVPTGPGAVLGGGQIIAVAYRTVVAPLP